MQKLLIATSNSGKLLEYRAYLSELPLQLLSLKDVGLSSIEETENTFEENALLKARTYFRESGFPCIADDGGFEIDALGGLPGIKSHRWATGDENVTDEELVAYTLERMKDIPEGKRTARFRTVVAFIDGDGKEYTAETATEGTVPHTAGAIAPGLPYRAILYIPRFKKLFEELSPEEHALVNQRVRALEKIKPAIKKAFLL